MVLLIPAVVRRGDSNAGKDNRHVDHPDGSAERVGHYGVPVEVVVVGERELPAVTAITAASTRRGVNAQHHARVLAHPQNPITLVQTERVSSLLVNA